MYPCRYSFQARFLVEVMENGENHGPSRCLTGSDIACNITIYVPGTPNNQFFMVVSTG